MLFVALFASGFLLSIIFCCYRMLVSVSDVPLPSDAVFYLTVPKQLLVVQLLLRDVQLKVLLRQTGEDHPVGTVPNSGSDQQSPSMEGSCEYCGCIYSSGLAESISERVVVFPYMDGDSPVGRSVTPRPSKDAKLVAIPFADGLAHTFQWQKAA